MAFSSRTFAVVVDVEEMLVVVVVDVGEAVPVAAATANDAVTATISGESIIFAAAAAARTHSAADRTLIFLTFSRRRRWILSPRRLVVREIPL